MTSLVYILPSLSVLLDSPIFSLHFTLVSFPLAMQICNKSCERSTKSGTRRPSDESICVNKASSKWILNASRRTSRGFAGRSWCQMSLLKIIFLPDWVESVNGKLVCRWAPLPSNIAAKRRGSARNLRAKGWKAHWRE